MEGLYSLTTKTAESQFIDKVLPAVASFQTGSISPDTRSTCCDRKFTLSTVKPASFSGFWGLGRRAAMLTVVIFIDLSVRPLAAHVVSPAVESAVGTVDCVSVKYQSVHRQIGPRSVARAARSGFNRIFIPVGSR